MSVVHEGIYDNIMECIGQTPMVRLNSIPDEAGLSCELIGKCEFFNPSGSVKDRIALRIIQDAIAEGQSEDGLEIVEASSGNTGIALATIATVMGHKFTCTMAEKMSEEKEVLMEALGAQVIRTPNVEMDHPESNFAVANKLVEQGGNRLLADQFCNPSNVAAHEQTALEILEQCGGRVDAFICSVGTGGTLTGVSAVLKEHNPDCVVVAVDPIGSSMAMMATEADDPPHRRVIDFNACDQTFQPYLVEGIGYDFVPEILNPDLIDHWIKIGDDTAFAMARKLACEEGLLVGGSSGASVAGAIKFLQHSAAGGLDDPKKRVVVLIADGLRSYLSTFADDDWLKERGLLHGGYC